MGLQFGMFIAFLASLASGSERKAPLHNPTLLNIGFVCHWQRLCMDRQERAMKRALGYVRKSDPPRWKIQLCNRNAARKRSRVDWIGFNNCIRNSKLKRPATRRR